MKKRGLYTVVLLFVLLIVMAMLTACGGKTPYSSYDLSEYVKVADYKGLEYEEIKVTVTDEDVEEEIEARLADAAKTVEIEEGIVEDGDTIRVAYEGKIDGKTFEGGSSEGYDITIGTTNMIDGFVEGLIGKEIGETVTLDLQFPQDYGKEELNGKDVVFTVTIQSKKIEEKPEYDLAFIKENSKFENKKDYEADVKKELLKQKEEDAETEVEGILWEKIVKKSELLKYPEEKNTVIENTMQSFRLTAEKAGKEWDEYLKEMGQTEKELEEQVTAYADTRVFHDMIIYSIAEAEKLEVTEKEYTEHMNMLMEQSGYDEKSFEENYGMTIEAYCEQEGLRSSMLLNKVMDKVMEYAKAK